jgi:hypothetical protein
MRRALALAGCGVLSVGLSACESTEQESAKIGRENEAADHAAARLAAKTHVTTRLHGHGHTFAHRTPAPGAAGTPAKGSASP